MGEGVSGGGWWAARGMLYLPQEDRQQCCVFTKLQKQIQFIAQPMMVVGSSLAPQTSLLVPPIGSTGPVVHLHGLTGLVKSHL